MEGFIADLVPLRFHTNPCNQHYANYHENLSHMRRFIIVYK